MEAITLQRNTNMLRLEGIDILLEINDIDILRTLVDNLKKSYKDLSSKSKTKNKTATKTDKYPELVNSLIGVADYEEDYEENYHRYLEEKYK